MTKYKFFLPALLLIPVAVFVLINFWGMTKSNDVSDNKVKDESTLTIRGVLYSVGYNDSLELSKKYEISDMLTPVQIVSYDKGMVKRYLVRNISDQGALSDFKMSATEKLGYCIEVLVQKSVDPISKDYYEDFGLLDINNFKFLDSLDCYQGKNYNSNMSGLESPSQQVVTLNSLVIKSQRPSYDIDYDYEVSIPSEIATKINYQSASGLELEPIEMVSIFLVPSSLEIEKKMENAKRSKTSVKISGVLTGGYAETTHLKVTAIE